jgi:hypothetical protein
MQIIKLTLLLTLMAPLSAIASEGPEAGGSETHTSSDGATKSLFPSEEHESHYRNYVAGFAGYTSEERGEGGLTLGGELTHRFSKHTGLGLIAEYVSGDVDAWVALVATGYRTERWKFYGGIGFEDPDDHGRETLYRVGMTHVIPWKGRTEWLVTAAVDFVDGDSVWLLGLALGYGF